MVMAGDNQDSAKRYFRLIHAIDSQKLWGRRNIPKVKGREIVEPRIQTRELVIGFFFENLSQIIPPTRDEMKARIPNESALAKAN